MPRRPINQYDIAPGSLTAMVVAEARNTNEGGVGSQQGIIETEYRTFLDPAAATPITESNFAPGTKVRIVDLEIYSQNTSAAPNPGDIVEVIKIPQDPLIPVTTLFTVTVPVVVVLGQILRADRTIAFADIDPSAGDSIRVECAAWIAGGLIARVKFEAVP